MYVESNSLTSLSEGLNYSVNGLLATFGTARISTADAQRLGRKPNERGLPVERQRAIANIVYGGKWGRENLGNTQPEDGWTFRGYGPIQLTGRSNCASFGAAIGMHVDEVPAYLRTREGGGMGAAWFWRKHYLDKRLDPNDVRAMRTAVNAKALGFDLFEPHYHQLASEFARRARDDPPH
jgi:putative chitinase